MSYLMQSSRWTNYHHWSQIHKRLSGTRLASACNRYRISVCVSDRRGDDGLRIRTDVWHFFFLTFPTPIRADTFVK